MVILVGGSSHVGKTLIAQRLMEHYKFPYLSLDHLKMGFIRSGTMDLDVEDDLRTRYRMWPFVAEIVKTVIENGQNLIVEGCYIPGEWTEAFTEEYLRQIRCVFIVMSEEYLRTRMDDVVRHADAIEKRGNDEVDPERLIRCSMNFKADCVRNGIPMIEIDGEYDLRDILDRAIRLIGKGNGEI